ncbi:hypothetical protein PGT21_010973 [Puccinia graminis f. sp. tritici]|uniref:Uncharacterized protein n=1 Tax=Puccinia graminis f. sp. tritici TaxID=56615 RepID=A0A5B0PG21_PUCGR|nr:hypothetical protein PGT21_010973 [Puccinia graminis f. sp. tritici]
MRLEAKESRVNHTLGTGFSLADRHFNDASSHWLQIDHHLVVTRSSSTCLCPGYCPVLGTDKHAISNQDITSPKRPCGLSRPQDASEAQCSRKRLEETA